VRALAARLKRLEQIETRIVWKPPVLVMGNLRRLPRDYIGEKHVVELNRRPSPVWPGSFNCEFEERPGPEPRKPDKLTSEMHVYFVLPYEQNQPAPGAADRPGIR
jgi:hypothetical protein